MAVRGHITVGQLTSFLNYANQYTKPFNEISGVVTELQNSLASASRVFELIDEQKMKEDAPDARVLTDARGNVDIEHVYFSYTADRKPESEAGTESSHCRAYRMRKVYADQSADAVL